MTGSERHGEALRQVEAGCSLILLQCAAARAEIGSFARRGLETPQAGARCYDAASRLTDNRRRRLA